MFKDNLISQQQFDEAASRYQSTQASYDLALQEVERLKALVDHERGQRAVGGEKAERTLLSRRPIPVPIKSRDVHPGEYLKVQEPVMVLVRTDRLRARLAVPERWAGWIKDGAVVDLRVEAFPGESFQGKVTRINPAVAQDSRTFEAEALIDNHDGRLKPGFFVQASLPSEKEEKRAVHTGIRGALPIWGVQGVRCECGSRKRTANPPSRANRRSARSPV